MDIVILIVLLGAFAWAAPYLLESYVGRLPVAPSCPGCRAVTRGSAGQQSALSLLPVLATTVVRECARCGWRGRMRWRWATERARGT